MSHWGMLLRLYLRHKLRVGLCKCLAVVLGRVEHVLEILSLRVASIVGALHLYGGGDPLILAERADVGGSVLMEELVCLTKCRDHVESFALLSLIDS